MFCLFNCFSFREFSVLSQISKNSTKKFENFSSYNYDVIQNIKNSNEKMFFKKSQIVTNKLMFVH